MFDSHSSEHCWLCQWALLPQKAASGKVTFKMSDFFPLKIFFPKISGTEK